MARLGIADGVGDEAFRSFFENALDAVLIANDEGVYVAVNEAGGQLLGLHPSELLGRSVNQFVDLDGAPFTSVWADFIARGELDGELPMRRADGKRITVHFRARANFQPGLHLSILRDITEQKLAAEALTRSNTDLQQFAFAVSHDLQEPLRTITNFAELLQRRYGGQAGPEAEQYIRHIVSGAVQMSELIDGLLRFSRAGTVADTQSASMRAAVEAALRNLRRSIELSKARVTFSELPTVAGDQQQLTQLLQNLVSNAIKYHGADPPRIHITAEPTNGSWLFRVTDNGFGIAPEYADRIFGLFQRFGPSGSSGSGLGLAICRRIVERHGGKIWVEPNPEGGSVFCFTLVR